MKSFKITKHLEAICESEKTRNGFRHLAVLLRDNREVESAKATYQNRTWERFEYQSVLEELLRKSTDRLSKYELSKFKVTIK